MNEIYESIDSFFKMLLNFPQAVLAAKVWRCEWCRCCSRKGLTFDRAWLIVRATRKGAGPSIRCTSPLQCFFFIHFRPPLSSCVAVALSQHYQYQKITSEITQPPCNLEQMNLNRRHFSHLNGYAHRCFGSDSATINEATRGAGGTAVGEDADGLPDAIQGEGLHVMKWQCRGGGVPVGIVEFRER
jgi:hypothetical protein